ncbi:MAG: rRNA methyltransferase 2, mitochondrial, partial [Pseudomonadota bacterium]
LRLILSLLNPSNVILKTLVDGLGKIVVFAFLSSTIPKLVSAGAKVDIVLSDMAVNTTGNKDLDAMKTNSIALDVVNLSKVILKPKSSLLVKIFSGKDENILIKNAKDSFKIIERIKPDSSRKESREMYLLCRDLKTI